MHVDYLIVGQGLCGTFLSYNLLTAGKKILVIDKNEPFTASKVASGVINPVTGRRIVRTWRIEELLPFALEAYGLIGNEISATIVRPCRLFDFHATPQMKEAFDKRLLEEPEYLHKPGDIEVKNYFNYYFEIGEVAPCLLIDINTLLVKWREKLKLRDELLEENFNLEECSVADDRVEYKNIQATKIIFCDGVAGTENIYFKNLPYATNKGEALIAEIDDLPEDNIYKQGLSIVPFKQNLFWVGSSYEWNYQDDKPSPAFRNRTESQLASWLKPPFKVVDHVAGLRPANMERRPFVGIHPKHTSVAVLNGMGTKGCSLAPFFAKQLADHLIANTPIYPDADVRRFEKVLSRKIN